MFTYEVSGWEIFAILTIVVVTIGIVLTLMTLLTKVNLAAAIVASLLAIAASAYVLFPVMGGVIENRNEDDLQAWAKDRYNIELSDETARAILENGDTGDREVLMVGDEVFYAYWSNDKLELRDLVTNEELESFDQEVTSDSHGNHDHGHLLKLVPGKLDRYMW